MKKKKFLSSKVKTINFLKYISKNLVAGDIIFFEGDFGVGKTFSASVIIKQLSGENLITSPTYNLIQIYKIKENFEIWHCDFYRLMDFDEIEEIGVFDDINTKIILIEWPKFQKMYNVNPLILNIQFGKKVNERIFTIKYNKSWVNKIDFLK